MASTVKTNAGVEMPRIIYGTAWKKEMTSEFVVKAFLLGFRGFDTACQPKHYNEGALGHALQFLKSHHGINRNKVFIQTKFTALDGQDPKDIPYDKNADLATQVQQSLAKSLENLGTNYVDSLVMHSPMSAMEDTMKVYREFEEFVRAGSVKQLGLSNVYDLKTLKDVYDQAKIKPSVLQNRFYSNTNYDKEIRKFCDKKKIYYQSFWTLTANENLLQCRPVVSISQRHSKTPAQVWFKYVTERLKIILLTGARNEDHMRQALSILDWRIDTRELEAIDPFLTGSSTLGNSSAEKGFK